MTNGQQYSEATKVFKKVIWTRLFLRCAVAHLLYYYYIIYLEIEQAKRAANKKNQSVIHIYGICKSRAEVYKCKFL